MSEVKWDLKVDKRLIKQLSESAIKKDPVRAVVELITNSDDSYKRLASSGLYSPGIISVEIIRKRKNAIFRVVDYAEGFDDDTMDKRIGYVGSDTSGLTNGLDVRGYFGRGLKEAILGLGNGIVRSFKDNHYYECSLDEEAIYNRKDPMKAKDPIRKDLGILKNGTIVEITVTKDGVSIPQIENFTYQLEKYYSLRDINSSKSRSIFVIEKDEKGKKRREPKKLEYKFPIGRDVLNKEKLEIAGYPTSIGIQIFQSDVALSTDSLCRDGGLLIKGKSAIHDISLFSYEGNPYAAKLYGTVQCEYIDDLLKKDEQILSDRRDGLDWSHPFCKSLRNVVDKEIRVVIDRIKQEEDSKKKDIENEKTKQRFRNAIERINKIASDELGNDGKGRLKDALGDEKDIVGKIPEHGFDFIPDYYQIQSGRSSSLTLKAVVPWVVENETTIEIESDSDDVKLEKTQFIVKQEEAVDGIIIFHPRVYGNRVGAEAIITAKVNGYKAEAMILVVSKKEKKEKKENEDKRAKSILFSDIQYDPSLGPKVRHYYEKDKAVIKISSKHPSVEAYLGPGGEGQDELHCQVLIAELVIDCICREIARKKAEDDKLPILGERMDAVNREHNRLINEYAHILHQVLVSEDARRKLH